MAPEPGWRTAVYAVAMASMLGASALYHRISWKTPSRRALARRIDHAMIFVFIAGSYTPFTLVVLRGGWGWALLGVVWGLATVGVTIKLFNRLRHPLWSTALYVAMGWVVLVAVVPLVQRMPGPGLAWLGLSSAPRSCWGYRAAVSRICLTAVGWPVRRAIVQRRRAARNRWHPSFVAQAAPP